MPLTLVPPGQRIKYRKGRAYPNRYWLVRGTFDGREYEVSTEETDEAAAIGFKARLELKLLEGRIPGPGEAVTLGKATELYITYKQPKKGDERRIRRIAVAIGRDKLVGDVQHADIVAAADKLFPDHKNETKNRWAIKPAAAILHYAAENKWCAWLRIKKFDEGPIETRASSAEVAQILLSALAAEMAAAPTEHKRTLAYKKRLLILWLFKQGNRISDPLRLQWAAHISLERRVYLLYVGKAKKWKEKPMDEEVAKALARSPAQTGKLFPWRHRSGVYRWLRPLCRRLGIQFTPHRARHYLGKQLNALGAGQKTIMGALDQTDPKSAMRYQDADMDIVRDAIARPGKLMGKSLAKRRNIKHNSA